MDIHSQHETLELGRHQFQLELIDSFAGNEKIRYDYSLLWKKFLKEKKDYESLLAEATALRQESDFVKFQLDELVKVNLMEDEQEKLESELSVLEHTEEIKAKLNNVIQQLGQSEYSVNQSLSNIKSEFQSLASFSKQYEQLYQRIESARIELIDILREAENANEKTEFDPALAEQVNERLSLIYQLQHKHLLPSVSDLL